MISNQRRNKVSNFIKMCKTAAVITKPFQPKTPFFQYTPPVGSKGWVSMMNSKDYYIPAKQRVGRPSRGGYSMDDLVRSNYMTGYSTEFGPTAEYIRLQHGDEAPKDWRVELEKQVYDRIANRAKAYSSPNSDISYSQLVNDTIADLRDYETKIQLGLLGQRAQHAMRYGITQLPVGRGFDPLYGTSFKNYFRSLPINSMPFTTDYRKFNSTYMPGVPQDQMVDYGLYEPTTRFKGKNADATLLNDLMQNRYDLNKLRSNELIRINGSVVPLGAGISLPVDASPAIAFHEFGHGISAAHPVGGFYLGNGQGIAPQINSFNVFYDPAYDINNKGINKLLEEMAADNLGVELANSRYKNIPHFDLLRSQQAGIYPLQYANYMYKNNGNIDLADSIATRIAELEARKASHARNALINKDIVDFEKTKGYRPSPFIHGLVNPAHMNSKAKKRLDASIAELMQKMQSKHKYVPKDWLGDIEEGIDFDALDRFGDVGFMADSLLRVGVPPELVKAKLLTPKYAGPTRKFNARKTLIDAGLDEATADAIVNTMRLERKNKIKPFKQFLRDYGDASTQKALSNELELLANSKGVFPEGNNWVAPVDPNYNGFNYGASGYEIGDKYGLFNKAVNNAYNVPTESSIYSGVDRTLTDPTAPRPYSRYGYDENGIPISVYG